MYLAYLIFFILLYIKLIFIIKKIINSNASKCPKVEINRSRYAELKKDTIVKRLIDLKISKIYEYERNNSKF